jgi:hypothetical protein
MRWIGFISVVVTFWLQAAHAAEADLSKFDAKTSEVKVEAQGQRVTVTWPSGDAGDASVVLRLDSNRPLIESLSVGSTPLLRDVDPVYVITVGSRNLNDKAGWVAFFDKVPTRPYQPYLAALDRRTCKVASNGPRAMVAIGELTAGPFKGELRFTFYPGSPLVHVQAVVSTDRNGCAIVYDAGLVSREPMAWQGVAWIDSSDEWQRSVAVAHPAEALAVRNRAIYCEAADNAGTVAVFPPPHQFLYPLDFADNFRFAWHGENWRDLVPGSGFGVRQTIEGDGRFVPWVNAPPNTQQKLGVFLYLSRDDAAKTAEQVPRFTRNDRFAKLDGHVTFSSHYHVEHTLDFVAKQKEQHTTGVPKGLEDPGFVKAFKRMGVDIVHLAEFHVAHTPEITANRLKLLKTLHDECRRLSGDGFLLLPGEEPNVHLGGHWISLFPKPVYWTLQRANGQPFEEQADVYGTVYHVGSAADVLKLMESEKGLMWTAHPRIKSSFGFPDAYKSRDFFRSDRFLGAAWKAMPADNSLPRLGTRVLDLLDDMNNWGGAGSPGWPKFAVGEVDVFKVEPDYELYGHANVNYVRLDRVAKFDEGWQSVVDALHDGKFFVTTGEVLLPLVEIEPFGQPTLHVRVDHTFPLAFAEVITGDGKTITRQHVDLTDTRAFGSRELRVPLNLAGKTWYRFEVWDVAANGAFTQPVPVR